MLGVSYTFIAYVWFILCNDFLTKNKIRPVFLEVFAAKVLKRIWFWKFDDVEPFYTICFKNRTKTKEEKNLNNKAEVYNITDANLDLGINKNNDTYNQGTEMVKFTIISKLADVNLNSNALDSPSDSSASPKTKCNSCDLCESCQKDKQKDKDKKKKKDLVESNVSALNHFACFCLICMELICNTTVWLLISYPPSSY
jgi:hypothetical protein